MELFGSDYDICFSGTLLESVADPVVADTKENEMDKLLETGISAASKTNEEDDPFETGFSAAANLIHAANPMSKLQPMVYQTSSSSTGLKPLQASNTKLGLSSTYPVMMMSGDDNGLSGSPSGIRVGVDTGPDIFQPWQWSQKEKMEATMKQEMVNQAIY